MTAPPRKKRAARFVWERMRLGYSVWCPSGRSTAFVVCPKNVVGRDCQCRVSTLRYLEEIGAVQSETVYSECSSGKQLEGDTYWTLVR